MRSHPTNSSSISGVRTGGYGKHGTLDYSEYRAVEEEVINKEGREESRLPVSSLASVIDPVSDKPICEAPFSPGAKECQSKFKKEGFYFCAGKEGCPFTR